MSVRTSMFLHLLKRGLLGRGNRPLIALIALTVAATMITAMLSLYYGLENKLNRDFRSYGANITVAAPDGQTLPDGAVRLARSVLDSNSVVAPFAFAIAHTSDGGAVVVAGTDMSEVQALNGWWSVSRWPAASNEALVGARAESRLQAARGTFDLEFAGRRIHLIQAGSVKSGSEDEDRIYIPLESFEAWSGIRPSLLETQGAVVSRMRSVMLASTVLISLTVLLCIFATLTSSILERRRDFAVMKAIGSSQAMVNALFAGEALGIALCAGVGGYAIGSAIAAWISQANFHAVIAPQWSVLPVVVLASMVLALLAAMLPLARLQRIEPAGILKGE